MEAEAQHWFVYAALPGIVKMPDITPHAFLSTHDTFKKADDAATKRRLGPEGEVLVCDDDIVRARDVYSLAVEHGARP